MFKYITLFLTALLLLTIFCSNSQSPKSSQIVYSEKWSLKEPGKQNTATILLSKHQDSTYSSSGKWVYVLFGNIITCTYMAGEAEISDSIMNISARGTGSYPPDSTGVVEQSGFLLNMNGIYKNKTVSGKWKMHFDNSDWNGWADSGFYSGTLDSGSNVTKQ